MRDRDSKRMRDALREVGLSYNKLKDAAGAPWPKFRQAVAALNADAQWLFECVKEQSVSRSKS